VKTCRKCNLEKDKSEFWRYPNGVIHAACKECERLIMKTRRRKYAKPHVCESPFCDNMVTKSGNKYCCLECSIITRRHNSEKVNYGTHAEARDEVPSYELIQEFICGSL
jgi:hypothetical protein